MCWSCVLENMEEGELVAVTDEMRSLAVMIRNFYDLPGCSVGGPLHVVLDDSNVEDAFLHVWEPWFSDSEPRDPGVRTAAEAILAAMQPLTENERMIAIELAWASRPFTSVIVRSATLHIDTQEGP